MFPFRDHNPSGRTPFVTWALIAINIVVFLLYLPIMGDQRALASFFDTWAMVPAEITAGEDYYTALTSMFLHGGFMHIAGNMLFLYIYGDNVEDAMGHVWFLIFYLVCGFGADAAHLLSDPNSRVPVVGASGAIAGVMGAYLLLYPKAKIDVLLILIIIFRVITLPAFVILGLWMILQFFGGFQAVAGEGGVAYWAHIGGFVVGVLLTLPLFMRLGGPKFWEVSHMHPPHKETFKTRKTKVPMVEARESSVPVVKRRR
ncbi:MAG: rhomboid family intramembrane serine protease [Pseudomonadota bacterium]